MTPEVSPQFPDADALIPAAGSGQRLGRGPKGLLQLGGRPLALWAAEAVRPLVRRVFIALPPGLAEDPAFRGYEVIEGAASRQETVERLVALSDARYVMTHDSTRPFASRRLLAAVLEAVRETGLATAGVLPAMPVIRVAGDRASAAFPRSEIRLVQSPQAFDRQRLLEALARARSEGREAQSCMELFDFDLNPIRVVPGEETNIKITTETDWVLAREAILPRIREPGASPQLSQEGSQA